jgi:hypothetical protein
MVLDPSLVSENILDLVLCDYEIQTEYKEKFKKR